MPRNARKRQYANHAYKAHSWETRIDGHAVCARYSWHGSSCSVEVWCDFERVLWRGRFHFCGHIPMDVFLFSKELLMGMLKKPQWKEKVADSSMALKADKLAEEYPVLWAFLSERVYADGASRQTGTLTISVEDGVCKGCLRDREESRILFVSASGLAACLDNANAAVEEDGSDWRADKFATKKKK